jgi:hypothetical protein
LALDRLADSTSPDSVATSFSSAAISLNRLRRHTDRWNEVGDVERHDQMRHGARVAGRSTRSRWQRR